MKTNEQKITESCTLALDRGKRRIKLPAAVVRGLMVELRYQRTQAEGWKSFADARGDSIVNLRATVASLTNLINKMGEITEKAETRATAAEADVREMADVIRDLRDRVADLQASLQTQEEAINTANARAAAVAEDAAIRVAAAEAEAASRLAVIRNLRDLTEEYEKSFRVQEVIVHNARNEALELGRKLDAAETKTVAEKKRADYNERMFESAQSRYESSKQDAKELAIYILNISKISQCNMNIRTLIEYYTDVKNG